MYNIITIIVTLLLLNYVFNQTTRCVRVYNGTTYDYDRYLHTASDPIRINDIADGLEKKHNITLFFNYCHEIEPPSQEQISCSMTGPDKEYPGFKNRTGFGYAFYIDHEKKICHRLGGNGQKDFDYVLIDYADPSKGLLFNYTNGDDYCLQADGDKCVLPTNYELRVRINCVKSHYNLTKLSPVTIRNNRYTLDLHSMKGCPVVCPVSGEKLCSGHGVCGWDYDNLKVKCFCNTGYEGSDCSKKTKSASNPMIIAIVFVALLVITVSVSIGYIFYKLRKIQANPDAYDTLDKKFNELGQYSQLA